MMRFLFVYNTFRKGKLKYLLVNLKKEIYESADYEMNDIQTYS